jgi:hypothetical protein
LVRTAADLVLEFRVADEDLTVFVLRELDATFSLLLFAWVEVR